MSQTPTNHLSRTKYRLLVWTGGTLALALGALALVVFTGASQTGSASVTVAPVGVADITAGPASAQVVLIEYTDYECEACARFAPILATLREEYSGKVRWVYRFFPLDYHPYAVPAAQAAYAAHLQGKFWEMNDLLYEKQREWAHSDDPYAFLEGYAQSLGLDMARFNRDAGAKTTAEFIAKQKAEGSAAGVDHTPWFLADGASFVPYNIGDFRAAIDAALE